jgi:long-chain acyl-CoA synthetase
MAEYLWYKSYDPGVPRSIAPYPDQTAVDVFNHTAHQLPNLRFMIYKGRDIPYSEGAKIVDNLASALKGAGVKKGDRVATMMLNCPQGVISLLATMKLGAIAVPLNPLYSEGELEHALKTSGAEVLILWSPLYGSVKKIQPRTKLRLVIATELEEYMPAGTKVTRNATLEEGDVWWEDLLAAHSHDAVPSGKFSADDTALLLFSGGTTGAPKAAMLSHKNILSIGLQIKAWHLSSDDPTQDVTVLVMPIFHAFGCNGVMFTALTLQSPMAVVPNPRDMDDLVDTLKKTRPAFFPAVPTIFINLLEHPEVKAGNVDFSSMRFCLSGAIPLMVETKQRFEQVTGGRLLEAYGMTETTVVATIHPYQGKWKEGSVGLPMPDVVLKFVDVGDPDKDLPYGQEGEVVLKGPQIMQGYWNNPGGTAEMIKDGWLYTGDIGYMDEDGFLFLTSRKKDLIKPSGHQVWPREVEEVISTHPCVAEVGVAGIPDAQQVEAVKAWVVLRPGERMTGDDLQAFCKGKLTAYKVPKFIEFREALPKTLVGKVLRRVLQEEEKTRQAKAVS